MAIALRDDWNDRAAWDCFVEQHEQGRFCHLYSYGDVVACYGYKPERLAFLDGRNLVGVLPAALTASLLLGRKLVSQPFSEYGGLLLDPTLGGEDVCRVYALLEAYLNRHRHLRALELHGAHGVPASHRPGPFVVEHPHHVAVLALDRPPDQLWRNVVQHSVRKGVTKAQTNGVAAFEECDAAVLRERFYPLYLKSMKRLGVPPHALAYYLRCFEFLGSRMKIFWAARERQILAGLLGFVCGKRVNIVNIVSDPESWKYAPNDL
ncbi:MAG: GNAT family N-acetyltransferase, partial [Stellaceae bacterium]